MRFTLSSTVLPWLCLAADDSKCSIIPEGVDQSGAGGGGSAPPATAAPPAPASQVPDPSSLRVISRPGSTTPPPAQQAPAPAAPQGAPQGGSVPAPQQQQPGQQPSPYITRDELKTLLAESLNQHFQQLGQTVAPQAPAGQSAAGQSNPANGGAQQQPGQQSQILVAQATPEFLAVQTKVREQEQQIREQAQALAEIQKAKADAEYKADVASATNAAQRALTDHPTYRMQAVAAAQAVEVMLLKGRIGIHPQADGSKQAWVMLPNAQTGKTDVFSLHEGVVKWLESPEGAFYRPQVKPGMGAMASTPGHAPISVPAQTQVPQGAKTPASLQEAYEKQQALSQGRGPSF